MMRAQVSMRVGHTDDFQWCVETRLYEIDTEENAMKIAAMVQEAFRQVLSPDFEGKLEKVTTQ